MFYVVLCVNHFLALDPCRWTRKSHGVYFSFLNFCDEFTVQFSGWKVLRTETTVLMTVGQVNCHMWLFPVRWFWHVTRSPIDRVMSFLSTLKAYRKRRMYKKSVRKMHFVRLSKPPWCLSFYVWFDCFSRFKITPEDVPFWNITEERL